MVRRSDASARRPASKHMAPRDCQYNADLAPENALVLNLPLSAMPMFITGTALRSLPKGDYREARALALAALELRVLELRALELAALEEM